MTAATIGVVYRYDLSNMSGALLFIAKTSETESVTVVIAGSNVGVLVAGPLANLIGRRLTKILLSVARQRFALASGFTDGPL